MYDIGGGGCNLGEKRNKDKCRCKCQKSNKAATCMQKRLQIDS